jgi:ribosomal protein S18 acetylase RimI-like enzyme
MHIRTATIEDYPALAVIGRESQGLHHQAHPTLFQSDSEGFTVEHVRAMLAGEQSTIYVAEDEGQLLGYAFLRTELRTDLELFRPHVIAEITDIAVTTRMRSQGIGQQLFAAARAWAREWGAERLELVVWEFNTRAIDFYQRQGMHTLTRTMSLSLEEQ